MSIVLVSQLLNFHVLRFNKIAILSNHLLIFFGQCDSLPIEFRFRINLGLV